MPNWAWLSPRWSSLREMSAWWRAQAHAPAAATREHLYQVVLDHLSARPGDYLEFGVAAGGSLRWWVDHLRDADARFFGFDTFEGLPEQWGRDPEGAYSTEGAIPDLGDPRVAMVVGLFADTLPHFDVEMRHPLIAHLDADLYASTATALGFLATNMRAGDILLFDELLDVERPHHEFRAFLEAIEEFGWTVSVIGAVARGPQVAVEIEATGAQ